MKSNIFQRIENSKSVDFGDILSKSFELYKKVFTEGLMHTLITMVVIIPFMLVVYIPILPMYMDMLQYGGDPYYYSDPLVDYSVVWWIGYALVVFALSFLMQVVSIAIYAHFYQVMKKVDTGSQEEIGGYFAVLQGNFSKIFMLSLASFGIALLATLLCYLPIIYVMVPLQLILPIFVFNKELSVSEIIKAAFKLGNKHWLIAFGLILVSGIIASLGVIACYIGVIATAFFTHIVMYYFYKESVGFDDESEVFIF